MFLEMIQYLFELLCIALKIVFENIYQILGLSVNRDFEFVSNLPFI